MIFTVAPVTMTAMGVLAVKPALHALPLFMPLVIGATVGARRLADAIDRRFARAPLPA